MTTTISDLQSYEDVSEGLAVCIVAVDCQGTDGHLFAHCLQHLSHATWSPHSDGVAQ